MAATSAVVPRIDDLLRQEEMPEAIIVPAIGLAIGPFFVESAGLAAVPVKGKSGGGKTREALGVPALRSLRLSALSLACTVRPTSGSKGTLIARRSLRDIRSSAIGSSARSSTR